MKRRSLLSALVGSAAGLAGCVSPLPGVGIGGGATEPGPDSRTEDPGTPTLTTVAGPARFADARIDGPAAATVGRSLELTVSVANVGNRAGDFTGTLRAVAGDRDRSRTVSVTGVEPGTRGSTTVSIAFERPGDYELELTGGALDPATYPVTVEPVRAGPDEPVTVGGDLRATLRGIAFPWAIPYTKERKRYDDTSGVAAPPSGTVFAMATWSFENRGAAPTRVDPARFRPADGSVRARVGPVGVDRVADGGPAVVSTGGVELDPGESVLRRLLVVVDREAAADGVAVGLTPGGEAAPRTAVFEVAPGGESFRFPSSDLASVEYPGTLAADAPDGRVAFTVENTGEVAATVDAAIQWRDGDEWRSDLTLDPDAFSAELAPGETREFAAEWNGDPAARGTFTYRIAPFGRQFQVTFE